MNRLGYLASTTSCLALLLASNAQAAPTASASLNACQAKVQTEGKVFVQNTVNAVGTCLKLVSNDVIKNSASIGAATSKACVAQFRKLNDTRSGTADKSIEAKFRSNVDKKCVPGITPSVTHTINDITAHTGGGAAEKIESVNLDLWCKKFGGDGSIDSVTEWEDCLVNSFNCEAAAAIAGQFPRSAEWIDELITPAMNMNTVAPPASDPSKTTDAVAGATSFKTVLDPDGDELANPRCGGEATSCSAACCYIDTGVVTNCVQYIGLPASITSFTSYCDSLPDGLNIYTSAPGPCFKSPITMNLCTIGTNLVFSPPDSACPFP